MSAQPSPFPTRRALALAALAALALAGCGRIGPLEPPPEAAAAKPAMPKPNEMSVETLSPQTKPRIPPILHDL